MEIESKKGEGMSVELVIAYQKAFKELQDARNAAECLGKGLTRIADCLRENSWQHATIAGRPGYDPRFNVRGRPFTFQEEDWCTIDQLHEALIRYHTAFDAANKAWEALPKENRVGFTPPSK